MKRIFTHKIFTLFCVILLSTAGKAQVSGNVFRDLNDDGVHQAVSPQEPGEFGIVVRAYDVSNLLIASTSTNANGDYSFSAAQIPAGVPVRIEFILAADDFPSKRVAAGKSNVQFVTGGTANVDFALTTKKMFTNSSNPFVATTAYTNGDALAAGAGNAGDKDNLMIFPYNLSGTGGSTLRAKNQYLGAIFGLAWQRESRMLLMAAYLKRHCGFGPNGIGAIYKSQIDATGVPSTPTLLVDVSTIGINVGANPRTTTLPAASTTPNTDDGTFAEVGKRGIGSMDLSSDGRELFLINMFEKKLHRINIGNPLKSSFSAADVTGSWLVPGPGIAGMAWHPMAVEVHNNKVYVGGVAAKETTTAHNLADTAGMCGIVYEVDPNAASPVFVEVLRFPLTYRRGFVNADYRYEYRNNYWCAWQNNGDISLGGPLRTGLIGSTTGSNATGLYYPQPMLCNIEFDVDGSMVLGIRDRFGDQAGYANQFETGNDPGEKYRALATGEILRAGKSGSGWTLENNGSVTSNGVTTTTLGLTANAPALTGSFPGQTGAPWGKTFGPGGGYYYYNHSFTTVGVPAPFNVAGTNQSHYVKSNGGLAIYPGYNEVLMTAIDPNGSSFTNGIIRNYNTGANAGNMSGRLELIAPPSSGVDPTGMGKAAALGDLELLIDAQVLEIGNRVWNDANGNGIQDPNEYGIAGVTVVLRNPGLDGIFDNGGDQIWFTTTDAQGNYYFDETQVNDIRRPAQWLGVSNVHSGILSGFTYRVSIDMTQPALVGLFATLRHNSTNDAIDSDGSLVGTKVQFMLNPGGPATATSTDNNYNIDFGFAPQVLPVKNIDLYASLLNNIAQIHWNTTNELHIIKYGIERSTNGVDFSSIGNASSKGDGNFSYDAKDDLSGIMSSVVYYRLKIYDKYGAERYSKVVIVHLKNKESMLITPNPFVNNINVQIRSDRKADGGVSIYNAAGALVHRQKTIWQPGVNSIVISNTDKFPAGIYIMEIQVGTNKRQEKLVKK
jgi:trimeric autotransporter adhesin